MLALGLGLAIADAGWGAPPSTIPGAILILDAAVGFTPASWSAVVGIAATQSTGAKQGSLVANALNGQPGVLFGAGQQMILDPSAGLAAPGTILTVAKTTGDATNYRCLLNTDGLFLCANAPDGKTAMYMNGLADSGGLISSFSVLSAQVSAPNSIAYRINGTPSTSTTGVSYYSPGNYSVGGAPSAGQDLLGTICYVGVWNRVLTAVEIAAWETYAQRRWGI